MLRLGSAVAVCFVLSSTAPRAVAPEVAQTRALWVTRATLGSREAIQQMVLSADAGGFNTLMVQVRGRGDAYFNSTLEPRAPEILAKPGFDPLATTLELAHAAGLKVHAWVNVNLVSSAASLPAAREHVIYRSPEWLMVPRELAAQMRNVDVRSPAYIGQLARWTRAHSNDVEGLYTSPLVPAAADHTTAVIAEIAKNYAVDGVHLDYARYPNETFDYSAAALDQFKLSLRSTLTAKERQEAATREAIDPLAYPNLYRDQWDDFRRSRLTALVMRIRAAVRSVRPGATFSAAVVPDAQQAFQSRLQDWRTWLDESLLDVLCPMAYTTDAAVFQQHGQRDGEAVVDGGITHIRYRDAGRGLCLGDRDLGAEFAQCGRRRDVLMGMRLRTAAHANAGRARALAADHERCTAVGYRAAIQELQRHRHRF